MLDVSEPSPEAAPASVTAPPAADDLTRLLRAKSTRSRVGAVPHTVVGQLVAIAEEGAVPLVTYPGREGLAALRARSVVDLHGVHIGKSVVLCFENGDTLLPIVMGVLRQGTPETLQAPGNVQVEADGERMIVSASQQLVLQCGKASITLTQAGKVLIQGSYVSSRSTGVNRIKGGSVQLN